MLSVISNSSNHNGLLKIFLCVLASLLVFHQLSHALPYKLNIRFILTSMKPNIARTITVVLGDELREFIESLIESAITERKGEVIRESLRLLREKQAESRLQALRDLLTEGLSSGEPVEQERDAFLKKVKAEVRGHSVKDRLINTSVTYLIYFGYCVNISMPTFRTEYHLFSAN